MKHAKNTKGNVIIIVIIAVLLIAIGFLGWRVYKVNNDNKALKKQLTSASTKSNSTQTTATTVDHSRKFTVKVTDKKQDDNVHTLLFQLEIKNDSADRQTISASDIQLRTKSGELLSSTPTMNELFPEADLTSATLESGATVKKVLSFKVTLQNADSLVVNLDGKEQTVSIP